MTRALLSVMLLVSQMTSANPGNGFLPSYNLVTDQLVPTTQAYQGNSFLNYQPQNTFFSSPLINKKIVNQLNYETTMSQLTIRKNEREFGESLKNVFISASDLKNGEEIVNKMREVCRHAVSKDIYVQNTNLDARLCGLQLSNPVEACGLDRALSQQEFNGIIADLLKTANSQTSKEKLEKDCVTELRKRWDDPSRGQYVPDIISAAAVYENLDKNTWVEEMFKQKPRYEMTTEEARLFATKCHSGNLEDCDDFPQQLVEKSLADLARLYVVAAPQMGGGFLFFRKKSCDDCFPEKFAALTTNEPDNDAAQESFRKKNADDYIAYVEKKAHEKIVEAYSEYAKHIDRKNALNTMLGIVSGSDQGDACRSGDSLVVYVGKQSKSKAGCIEDSKLKERIEVINRKMFGEQFKVDGSPDQFMSNIVSSIKKETFEYENPRCINKQTPRSGFDRVRAADFNLYYLSLINDVRSDQVSKREVADCGERDQRCLVNVLKNYLIRKESMTNEEAESLIQRKYLGNPYLRLLIQSKKAWTSASALKIDKDVVKNFNENKQYLIDLAKQDAEEQCNSLMQDIASALCMKPEKAMAMVSPAKIRSEFQDEIDRISRTVSDPKEKNVQLLSVMGMACKAMDVNPQMNMDENRTAFVSDQSADSQNLADPVIRRSMLGYPKGAKQADEFHVYTDILCDPSNRFDRDIPQDDHPALFGFGGTNVATLQSARSGLVSSGLTISSPNFSLFPSGGSRSSMNRNCELDLTCVKAIDVGQTRVTLPQGDEFDFIGYDNTLVAFDYNPVYDYNPFFDAVPFSPIIKTETAVPAGAERDLQRISEKQNEITNEKVENFGTTVFEKFKDAKVSNNLTSDESSDGLAVSVGGDEEAGNDVSGSMGKFSSQTEVSLGVKPILGDSNIRGNFRSIASSVGTATDDGGRFSRRADYGFLESSEARQTNAELELMKQLSQTQLQSLQMQRQVSEMRLEMERLRQSTADAMAKASEIRSTTPKTKKNSFDTPPAAISEEPVVAEEDVGEDFPAQMKPKTTKQSVGQTASNKPLSSDFAVPENFGSLAPTGSRKPSGGGSSGNGASGGGNSGPVGGTRSVGIVTGGGLGATSSVGSVINSAGGSRSSSFAPSLTLQESITPTTTVEAIPQERKVELLKEFLGYVERNPGYQDGRYLNNANSQVVIDFQGRSLVVKVEDISDADLRVQLQERLLRQRVLLNQFVRSKRLATLQRLLAESRGGETP